MLRERAGLIESTLFFCDLLITIVSFLMAYYIRDALSSSFFEVLWPFSHYLNLLLAVLPIWAFVFRFSNLYRSYRTSTIFRECVKLAFERSTMVGENFGQRCQQRMAQIAARRFCRSRIVQIEPDLILPFSCHLDSLFCAQTGPPAPHTIYVSEK